MVEQPNPKKVAEAEKPPLPAQPQPDELRWWELQLGLKLPRGLYTETATGR